MYKRAILIIFIVLILSAQTFNTVKGQEPITNDDIKAEIHFPLTGEYSELPWDDTRINMMNLHMYHPNNNELIVFGKVKWETFDLVPYFILHGHFADGVEGKLQIMQIGFVPLRGWYPKTVEVPYDEQLYEAIKEAILAEDGDLLIERIGWYVNGVPTPTPTATFTNTPKPTRTPTPTATLTITPLPSETPTTTFTNTPKPTLTIVPSSTPLPPPSLGSLDRFMNSTGQITFIGLLIVLIGTVILVILVIMAKRRRK